MLKFSRSKKNRKDIEPHEIFIDKLAQKKEAEFGSDKKQFEVSISPTVLKLFSFIIIFFLSTLFFRSFQLQFVDSEYYSHRAQRNILSISQAQLLRGIIYDRNNTQLVHNLPQYDLYYRKKNITPENLPSIKIIAEIIEKDYSTLLEEIKNNEASYFLVKRDLSHEELVKIQTNQKDLTNFRVESSAGRNYSNSSAFAHILGYIGKINRDELRENPEKYTIHDYVGKMGIEKFYEKYLSRAGEKIQQTKDVSGNIIEEVMLEEAEKGKNTVLTIDARLQEISFRQTQKKLEEIDAVKASVVAMNPNNGEILAMVSSPSFDSNLFRQSANQSELINLFQNKDAVFLTRSISATYPTGSVIKPLLGAAALEEGIITPEKQIHSPGYISIPNRWNPSQPTIFRDFQAHGWRNMEEAIAVSSNVYFYAIGGGYQDQEGLGANRIKEYLNLFGWGERTEIDLPGEARGVIPTPEWKREKINDSWRIGDTYNLSIGQGYLEATPIQVANSFSSLVNGNTLYKPRLLKKVIDDSGNTVYQKEPEVIRENFISNSNLKVIKEGMRQATTIGTARSLQVLPVTSGAKTGTAQTSRPGINNNWVTVFAPYDNPEIVITVIIEEVRGVTPVATHLARDILLEYYTQKYKNDEEEYKEKKKESNQ